MIDRTNKGYYRCKIKYEDVYNDYMKVNTKYCMPVMLAMLQHNFPTQKNEAMNHSVVTLAPKTKDFLKQVHYIPELCCVPVYKWLGVAICGTCLFFFKLESDTNLARHLKVKENKKRKK